MRHFVNLLAPLLVLWVSSSEPAHAGGAQETCKRFIAEGNRAAAIAACKESLRANAEPSQMADMVKAYTMGQGRMSPEDLFQTALMARGAARWGEPWASITRCHLGNRLGDEVMLKTCMNTLSERFSTHPEARATLLAMKRSTPWLSVFSWFLLISSLVLTAVHWFRSRVRSAPPRALAVAQTMILLALCSSSALHARPAFAQQGKPIDVDIPYRFPIDDANPRASVPSDADKQKFPMDFGYFLQDVLDRAERATKEKRYADAAKYYFAVAAAVPDVAAGFSKLCESLELAGKLKEAIVACKGALSRDGAKVSDHVRMVRLVLSQPDPLAAADLEMVAATVAHLKSEAEAKKQPETKTVAFDLECDLAKRTNNKALLAQCAAALATLAPNTARSISLQWAVAMNNNDKAAAERLVALGSAQKLSPDVLEKMKAGTANLPPKWKRVAGDWRILLASLVAGVAILFFAFKRRGDLSQRLA